MAQQERSKIRFVIEIDNVDLTKTAARKDLDTWIAELTTEVEGDLQGGEIISSSWWEEIKDQSGLCDSDLEDKLFNKMQEISIRDDLHWDRNRGLIYEKALRELGHPYKRQ